MPPRFPAPVRRSLAVCALVLAAGAVFFVNSFDDVADTGLVPLLLGTDTAYAQAFAFKDPAAAQAQPLPAFAWDDVFGERAFRRALPELYDPGTLAPRFEFQLTAAYVRYTLEPGIVPDTFYLRWLFPAAAVADPAAVMRRIAAAFAARLAARGIQAAPAGDAVGNAPAFPVANLLAAVAKTGLAALGFGLAVLLLAIGAGWRRARLVALVPAFLLAALAGLLGVRSGDYLAPGNVTYESHDMLFAQHVEVTRDGTTNEVWAYDWRELPSTTFFRRAQLLEEVPGMKADEQALALGNYPFPCRCQPGTGQGLAAGKTWFTMGISKGRYVPPATPPEESLRYLREKGLVDYWRELFGHLRDRWRKYLAREGYTVELRGEPVLHEDWPPPPYAARPRALLAFLLLSALGGWLTWRVTGPAGK